MIIKVSNSLTLGEWYTTPGKTWIRQDITYPQIKTFKEYCSSEITRVYFFPNICETFGLFFMGSLRPLKNIFRSMYGDGLNFKQDQVDEAKEFVDQFLKKIVNLKAFI